MDPISISHMAIKMLIFRDNLLPGIFKLGNKSDNFKNNANLSISRRNDRTFAVLDFFNG